MRIAFIGQKGIPATFGGIEYHVDALAQRLAQRGHTVHVYVRPWYTKRGLKEYRGVRLLHTPTIHTKHLDAFLHSLTSSLHSLAGRYDVVHYHALGPSIFCWLPKLFRHRVVVTLHGLDWKRGKWGGFARAFLKFTERTAVYIPDRTIVVSKEQKAYLEAKYHRKAVYIPNGVTMPRAKPAPAVIKQKYGLGRKDYLLWLGRITPEKRVDWLLRAYKELKPRLKLVIAGGSAGGSDYEKKIRQAAADDEHIVFPGFVRGTEKRELLSNARFFVLPSVLEGLPIALLEAMSYGLPCLASDIPPHKEIITPGINGFLFCSRSYADFTDRLKLLAAGGADASAVGKKAAAIVEKRFDWDKVTAQTEAVYHNAVKGGEKAGLR